VAVGVSFICCGLWHGIGVNFLIWGIVHCVGLMTVNVYRHVLTRMLGAKGVKTYMADRRIRALSTVATYQFVAASLLALFYA
jgi:D-alanyl-lipoteichoic acid acyltransferase DltB (MBOAT superfamily)